MTQRETKLTKSILTGLSAAMIATFMAAAPASAGGQIQINVAPQNADQDKAMRTGLALYSIVQGIKAQGGITQNGNGNKAGVAQMGTGNQGIIHQEGDGHNGNVQQAGNNNAYGLFQFGKNTNSHVGQSGNGGTGATFVFGW